MSKQGTRLQVSLIARLIVLSLAALAAACTTLSEPEQPLDDPVATVEAETSPDPEAEYEKAKQECADEGGEWVTFLHGDGAEHYTYSMRCWSSRPPPNDPSWKKPGLLPYDATISHARGTGEIIGFYRISPEYFERLFGGDEEDTDEKE